MGLIIEQKHTDIYSIYNADCMEVLPDLPDKCCDVSIYSPPFPQLYQYSDDPRDMSNCVTYQEGIDQYQYVINEMFRLTKPGRISAVHCMDLKKGSYFQRDFPGDIVRAHVDAGFEFFHRVTIWKDPWLIARRTRMRSLMHKTLVADSTKCRIAGPDYVLVFKKPGVNEVPVAHPNGLSTYAGADIVPIDLVQQFANYKGDQKKNRLSHWIWRQYASPVWMDIRSGSLVSCDESKECEEEKHVCPLQLDIIERLLTLYSNINETLVTPFMGAGSEPYKAIEMERRAIGIELKQTYYRQAAKNIQRAIDSPEQAGLFSGLFSGYDDDGEYDETEEP